MTTIVMQMSGYTIEQNADMVSDYGEEVLCAGWNPQLQLVSEHPVESGCRHATLPVGLANIDADDFLKKMYEYQG